jgi:NADPH-dependent glutamate synthase beta subunit-like oxidoreductase
VIDGMDFLRAFNAGQPLPLGKRIVVIGGGNVAYDVARSAVRPHPDDHIAYDVARSALRVSADKEVHVVCLESRAEMPADDIEIHEGSEEGIYLHNQRGPRQILHENGALTGLRTVRCTAVFDAAGKFNPSFDESYIEGHPRR